MPPRWPRRSRSPRRGAGGRRAHRPRQCAALARSSSGFFGELRELLGLLLGGERVDDLVELTFHDAVDLVEREVDAVVGDPALREVIGANPLGAVARADEGLARRGGLGLLLALLLVADLGLQHAQRLLAVLMLRAGILALDHDAGRQMGDADR